MLTATNVGWVALGGYLTLGLIVGPLSARRIAGPGERSPRRQTRTFARWLRRTPSGLLLTVVLWPLVAFVVQVGFLAGAWDWRGLRDPDDPTA